MPTPTNDTRALYDLLEVVGAGTNTPQGAWGGVLGADYGSLEFARRHAEVVGLYIGTMVQVDALPDRSRERFQKYAWSWWMSIMAPQHAWSTNVAMNSAVDEAALDQLGSVADLIESRMEGSLAVATNVDLSELRAVSQEWIDALLDDADLAEPLRMNLLQDLRHIMWLIENANIFGVARVTAVGQQVFGNLSVVGETLPAPKRGEWLARGKKLLTALVMIGALHAGIDTSMMLTEGAGHVISELTAGSSTDAPSAPGPIADGGES